MRTELFKSEGARWAAWFALVFLGLAAALLAAALWIVEDTQTAALRAANQADLETIENGFRDEGLAEALEVTRQRLGSPAGRPAPPEVSILIEATAAAGVPPKKLAGNLPAFAPRTGEFMLAGSRILGRGMHLADGTYAFVGRDTGGIAAARQRMVRAFSAIIGGAMLLAAGGGIFLRFQVMRRIEAITRTCEGIIAGRFDERIPLRGRHDDLERLSIAINEMLNRISVLLDNLRQVSSDVAHDLRTPLTRLRNRLEEARFKSVDIDDYAAAVSRAIGDTDQVLSIFSALLRISQIEAGTRAATFAEVSLSALLERVVEMYRPVAEDHDHRLSARIEPAVGIHGDAELLTQMFANLIENAIAHTPDHTTIRIELQARPDAVVAAVADDGPGIPAAERGKVLRRFYRLSGSRTTAGHGLGLSLVAAIATLHHAKLVLEDAGPGLRVTASFA